MVTKAGRGNPAVCPDNSKLCARKITSCRGMWKSTYATFSKSGYMLPTNAKPVITIRSRPSHNPKTATGNAHSASRINQ